MKQGGFPGVKPAPANCAIDSRGGTPQFVPL